MYNRDKPIIAVSEPVRTFFQNLILQDFTAIFLNQPELAFVITNYIQWCHFREEIVLSIQK